MISKIYLYGALYCLLVPSAFADTDAGHESSGGGDIVAGSLLDLAEQDELVPFDYSIRAYDDNLAHVYNRAFRPLRGGNDLTSRYSDFLTALNLCTPTSESIGSTAIFNARFHYGDRVASLQPLRYSYTNAVLENLNDEGVIRIENPETRVQLAIQQAGHVVVNRTEFESLDNQSKAAFKIHEGLICAFLATAPEVLARDGTANIRAFVRVLSNYASSIGQIIRTPMSAVDAAFVQMNPPAQATVTTVLQNDDYKIEIEAIRSSTNPFVIVRKHHGSRAVIDITNGRAVLREGYFYNITNERDSRDMVRLVNRNLPLVLQAWQAYLSQQ